MKKLIIIVLSLFISVYGFTQTQNNKAKVYANAVVAKGDSTHTFTIQYPNYEEARKLLMLSWGRPDVHEAGKIVWNNITINGIGSNLHVVLLDGISTWDGTKSTFVPFTGDNEKYSLLGKLEGNQDRQLELEISDQLMKNLITSKKKAQQVIDILLGILNY